MFRKIRLISRFITSQPGKEILVIHIFPYISKSKDNQIVTFVQLIEYNMRMIFLEKSYPKCGAKLAHNPFLKNQK